MKLRFDDVYDPEEEFSKMGRERTLKTETGIITFKAEDPYGFWKVHLDRGQLPDYLNGSFTSFQAAMKSASRWMSEKRLTVLAKSDNEKSDPIDRTSVIPEIKFKKVKKVDAASAGI